MSVRLVGKLLNEFSSIVKEGTKLAPETQEGITALIKAAPEIKAGELKVAEVIEDPLIRRSVLKRVGDYAPTTKEFLGVGTDEFVLSQKTNVRPTLEVKTAQKLEDVKDYLTENVKALKKGKGNFENLLNPVAAENLGLSLRSFSKYKKEADVKIPEDLQNLFDYFNKIVGSDKFKRLRGSIQFTPKVVQNLQNESYIANKMRVNGPEEAVAKFLFRSYRQPGSDVKLLSKNVEQNDWKSMKFQIGGRKIDFESIKKGIAENDPLFAEVKDAYDYKKAALSSKVMNPKTGMLESLNKTSYDVLGKHGYDLFHMSHIYDVGRTPLSFIQVTFGPYNRQMHNMLRGKQIPGGVESFLTRAKAVNLANPFAPEFIKKSPQAFAEEAALKLNEFYKLQKKKKSITFDKFMNFNKGGIVNLKYGNKFIRFK